MNSDANIDPHPSIGPKVAMVNKTSLVSLSFFLPVSGGSRLTC